MMNIYADENKNIWKIKSGNFNSLKEKDAAYELYISHVYRRFSIII